jgi:conjugative relaxase-like TrwC/TraI family protein
MNNTTLLRQRGGSAAAAIDYLWATEYYLDRNGQRQDLIEWGGKWKAQLGLDGQAVTREAMDKLAMGYHPTTGEALCRNAGAKPTQTQATTRGLDGTLIPKVDEQGNPVMTERGGHRIGYDVTFSAPKDYSLAFMCADEAERAQILQVQKDANLQAMKYLEARVETRRGKGGKDVIDVNGLVWSSHVHLAGRPDAEGVVDASIHTHNLVYGVCEGQDGKVGTFEAHELFELRRASDAIYKNNLYHGMRQLGYHLEQVEDKQGLKTTRLAGFDDKTLERYSKRQTEILDYKEKNGVDHETAWAATRREKKEPEYEEMSDGWRADLAAYTSERGIELSTEYLKNQKDKLLQKRDDNTLLIHLHEHEAILKDHQLLEALAHEEMGRIEPQLIENRAQDLQGTMVAVAPEAIHIDDQGRTLARRHTAPRYAAQFMIDREQKISERAAERALNTDTQLPIQQIERTISKYQKEKGFTLSQEQHDAVVHMCSSGGVDVLSGRAGSGKTTVSEVFVRAYREAGYEVYGCAPSWAAARKLEAEAGIKSYAVSSLLHEMDQGRWDTTKRTLIIMDEAGMVGTADTERMFDHLDTFTRSPKLILQGDCRQIQPVSSGSGLNLVTEQTGDSQLTEIRRQKHSDAQIQADRRAVANSFYIDADQDGPLSRAQQTNKGEALVQAMSKQGMLEERLDRTQAIQALLADWGTSSRPTSDRLILAHTNEDVKVLNNGVRSILKSQNHLAQDDHTFKTKTKNGSFIEQPFSEGEQIKFLTKNQSIGVVNNTRGRIESIDPQRNGTFDLAVRLDDKRLVRFNTSDDYNAIAPAYARTIHDAQGQGCSEIYHLAHAGMLDNQAALVAYTRLTDGKYTMYADSATMESLGDRLGLDRLKENATEPKRKTPSTIQVQTVKPVARAAEQERDQILTRHADAHRVNSQRR